MRAITGAEVTLARGWSAGGTADAHVTLLVESRHGLREPLPAPDRRARGDAAAGRERERCRRDVDQALLAERSEGLVCLSGCARHGLAVLDPNAAARLARAFGRDRFYVELQRPYERGDARRNAALRELAAALGVADRRDRRRARAPPAPRGAPGRARRDPLPHLARRLRAGAARQPRVACSLARRRCSSASPRDRAPSAHRASSPTARLRPDPGARLPLPRLLGRRRARRRAARAASASAHSRALRAGERAQATRPRARLEEELALIASSASPASSSSTGRCSSSRASARSRCAAPARRATCCRPGAGAAPRSARSSATSPASRTSIRSRRTSRSAAS